MTLDVAIIGCSVQSFFPHRFISSDINLVDAVTVWDNDASRPSAAEEGMSSAMEIARNKRVASGGRVSSLMSDRAGSSAACGFDLSVSHDGDSSFAGVDPDITFRLSKIIHAITGGALAGEVGAPIKADYTFIADSADGSGGGRYADGAAPSVTVCSFACGDMASSVDIDYKGIIPPNCRRE